MSPSKQNTDPTNKLPITKLAISRESDSTYQDIEFEVIPGQRGEAKQIEEIDTPAPASETATPTAPVITVNGRRKSSTPENIEEHVEEDIEEDIELIPNDLPADANVGQSHTVQTALSTTSPTSGTGNSRTITSNRPKRSPSNELLKTDDLLLYMEACAEYRRGLNEGWDKERLLGLIEGYQKQDSSFRKK